MMPPVVPSQLWRSLGLGLLLYECMSRASLTRLLVREVLRCFVLLDLAALGLLRRLFLPRYELVGACQRRGACCTAIVAEPPRALRKRSRWLHCFVVFHRLVHNFHLRARGANGELIFRCGYLRTDGKCGIYRWRPRLCRTYPLLPYFAAPKLLPGCGYRVKPRGMRSQGHARLPVLAPHVATHHPTPPTRPNDTALEHAEDFVLVGPYPPTPPTLPAARSDAGTAGGQV